MAGSSTLCPAVVSLFASGSAMVDRCQVRDPRCMWLQWREAALYRSKRDTFIDFCVNARFGEAGQTRWDGLAKLNYGKRLANTLHIVTTVSVAAVLNPLASKLSSILLCMCKAMASNQTLLSPGPYIANQSIANWPKMPRGKSPEALFIVMATCVRSRDLYLRCQVILYLASV